jgi:hypothetical protein
MSHAQQRPRNPLGLQPVISLPLADGDRGTAQTIARIRKLVHQGMTDQFVNRSAIQIVRGAGIQQFDFVGEVKAIYEWVKSNIRFTKDIAGIETLRTAREILLVRAGDCDDINSILLSSLLATIGHDVRLVTISSDPEAPRVFSHIYIEVEMGGQWVPLDSARRDPAFGRGPHSYFRKRIWSLTNSGFQDVQGLGGYYASAGRGRMRRMGDFDDIATDLSQIIGSAGTATASIIRATNTPSIGVPGFAVNPATGQLVPVSSIPAGGLVVSSTGAGIVTSAAGTIPNWMIYGGIALLGFAMLRR